MIPKTTEEKMVAVYQLQALNGHLRRAGGILRRDEALGEEYQEVLRLIDEAHKTVQENGIPPAKRTPAKKAGTKAPEKPASEK